MDVLTQLGVNSTLFIQVAIFLITFLVLHVFLIKPYDSHLKKRDEKTKILLEQSRSRMGEATKMKKEYEVEIRTYMDKAMKQMDGTKLEAQKKARAIVSEARKKSSDMRAENFKTIDSEIGNVKGELGSMINEFAKLLVSRIK